MMPIGIAALAAMGSAIIVLSKSFPGGKLLALVVVCNAFFSLVAHGLSANLLSKMTAGREPRAIIIWLAL